MDCMGGRYVRQRLARRRRNVATVATWILLVGSIFTIDRNDVVVRGGVHASIYPSNHWSYSNQIKNRTALDYYVHVSLKQGKTVFVRWIASPEHTACLQQAPAWNHVVQQLHRNPDVVFGDVNCADVENDQVVGGSLLLGMPFNPGSGGSWPTIRYFNTETGKEGAPYRPQTQLPLWEELGPKHSYLSDFVLDVGRTTLHPCQIQDGTNCTEKEMSYIAKMKSKKDGDGKVWHTESKRLTEMLSQPMKEELKDWVRQRRRILIQLMEQRHAQTHNDDEL